MLLHDLDEKTRILGAFDLAAMLAGTPIPTERLEALALASSTFSGYLDPAAPGRKKLGQSGVPEVELKAVSAVDAMAWNGMVLGFEYGAANCAARGREELGLSGVPEGELDAVSAEDAMAHCGRVLGFEYGAANCAARGREELGLSGVPEGEAVSAEDAKSWKGMVLGFEYGAGNGGANLNKKYKMNEETAEKSGRFFWSPQLSESFNAALEELGGLKAATAKSILERMLAAQSTSGLTREVVNGRLQHARNQAKKQAGEI